jgi:hypothetical protein
MKKVIGLVVLLAAVPAWATPIVVPNTAMTVIASVPDSAWPNSYVSGGNGSDVIFLNGPGAMNAMGYGTISLDMAIPDGTYTVSIRYGTGAVHTSDAGGMAVSMSKIGTATYAENGNVNNVLGWKSYYPASNYGVTANSWYNAQFAGPQGSAGWFCPVWTGSDLPTSITVSGVDGVNGKLTLSFYDSEYQNYDFAMVDSVTLTAVPEPITMSLLGLGSLALIRRK